MKILLAYIKIFCYGVENLFKFNIGDIVVYKNKEYTIIQGVCAPAWDLIDKPYGTRLDCIHQFNFKKKKCWYNFKHAFTFAYRFYKGYWFDIWMKNWSTIEMLKFTLKNSNWCNFGDR